MASRSSALQGPRKAWRAELCDALILYAVSCTALANERSPFAGARGYSREMNWDTTRLTRAS